MNIVGMIGNLTADPDIRYTQDNMCVAKFTIAINRFKEGTDFPRIIVFGKQAENCGKYISKGSKVGITGRIQTGSYEDKEGKKVYTTEVVADRVEFLSWKEKGKKSEKQEYSAIDDGSDLPF